MKEVNGYKEALWKAQEKVDHWDVTIVKAEAQIKDVEQWVAEAKKDWTTAQDEIKHLKREQEEVGKKSQVPIPTEACPSKGSWTEASLGELAQP